MTSALTRSPALTCSAPRASATLVEYVPLPTPGAPRKTYATGSELPMPPSMSTSMAAFDDEGLDVDVDADTDADACPVAPAALASAAPHEDAAAE